MTKPVLRLFICIQPVHYTDLWNVFVNQKKFSQKKNEQK